MCLSLMVRNLFRVCKLDVMKPCAEVIFNKGVAYSKLIDAYRLETVIYILKDVRKKSYSLEKELEKNGNLSQEGIHVNANIYLSHFPAK